MAVRIQPEDFDLGEEVRRLRSLRTDIGAVVTFTGTVRDLGEIGPITSMTLEHYPAMTEAELNAIEQEAAARWPLAASLIIHRIGTLQPGDNIVLVATASAHRQAAFEAAMFLMDFLKSRAPFWKKEASSSGETTWVDGRECDEQAAARWTKAQPKRVRRWHV